MFYIYIRYTYRSTDTHLGHRQKLRKNTIQYVYEILNKLLALKLNISFYMKYPPFQVTSNTILKREKT